MNLFNKSSVIGLTLLTSLLVVGCDKKAETPDTSGTTDTVETIEAVTTETVPVTQSTSRVAQLTSESLDNVLYKPIIASGTLTPEQVTCIEGRDKTLLTQKAQEYYDKNFTKDELAELDGFYNSPTGQKLIDYGNEQIKTMSGVPIETPMTPPTGAEMAEMQSFMESPIGQKYQQLNTDETPEGFNASIEPIVKAEFERCKIEGVF